MEQMIQSFFDNNMPKWEQTLARKRILIISGVGSLSNRESPTSMLDDISETMQRLYPGDYKIVEKYNPYAGRFDYTVEFDDPKEEMLWKLKWS